MRLSMKARYGRFGVFLRINILLSSEFFIVPNRMSEKSNITRIKVGLKGKKTKIPFGYVKKDQKDLRLCEQIV